MDPKTMITNAKILAGDVLRASMESREDLTIQLFDRLFSQSPAIYLVAAPMAWIDIFLDHALGGRRIRNAEVELSFAKDNESLSSQNIEDILESQVWAGRLIAARAADDREIYSALLKVICDDRQRIPTYVTDLLMVIVTTMKRTPRGYAFIPAEH